MSGVKDWEQVVGRDMRGKDFDISACLRRTEVDASTVDSRSEAMLRSVHIRQQSPLILRAVEVLIRLYPTPPNTYISPLYSAAP
jgi:hypothetical protein